MTRRLNRRAFLQSSGAVAATAAGYWLTGGLTPSNAGERNPLNRLNVALIGSGGRAEGNLAGVRGEYIVALCDVDENRARNTYNAYPNVPKFTDFRQMLDRQRDIEAVVVSTADHTHFHASATAIRAGKHVYCEKPLTHSVWEARTLAQLATRHRVATSMGNQGTSSDGIRVASEVLRSGVIGDVREVHVWTDRPGTYWRQGHANRPKERPAVPRGIDWNLWLGPAPERPYHSAYHPFAWRGWWDFGTGALGDMGCHTMNMAFMALRLGPPTSVVSETDQQVNNESPPNGVMVTYEFPARDNRPALQLKWYESRRPPMNLFHGQTPRGSGSLFVGTRGTLLSNNDYGADYLLLPRDNFADYRPPQPSIPRSPGHHTEWLLACKGGRPATANFPDYAGPLTEIVLLGNVAIRTGRRIVWDSANLRAVDFAGANQYIRREYRKGWEWNA
jgi:predicted dehydrogenase